MENTRCFSVSVPDDDSGDEDTTSYSDVVIEEGMPLPPQLQQCSRVPYLEAVCHSQFIDLTSSEDEPRLMGKGGAACSTSSATPRKHVDSNVIDLTSEPEQDDTLREYWPRHQSTPYPEVEMPPAPAEEPVPEASAPKITLDSISGNPMVNIDIDSFSIARPTRPIRTANPRPLHVITKLQIVWQGIRTRPITILSELRMKMASSLPHFRRMKRAC